MKTTNRSRDELRFVTSIEQITPYLDELRSNVSGSDSSTSSSSSGSCSTTMDDVDSLGHFDNDDDGGGGGGGVVGLTVPVALPPATSAILATTTTAPTIYDEYVNFIDLSVLNPIVAACDCQHDELIESERLIDCFFSAYSTTNSQSFRNDFLLELKRNRKRTKGGEGERVLSVVV